MPNIINERRLWGPLRNLSTSRSLSLELTVTNGIVDILFVATIPNPAPSLDAGIYTPLGLCEVIGEEIKTWIVNAFATYPGPHTVVSPSSIDLFIDPQIEPAPTPTLCAFALEALTGATINGIQAHPKQIKLKTAGDGWALLGLLEEGAALDRTENAVSNKISFLGTFQPRSFFCFIRAEQTTSLSPAFPDTSTQEERGGRVYSSIFGGPQIFEEITILRQKQAVTGPLLHLGEFLSLDGGRKKILLRKSSSVVSRLFAPIERATEILQPPAYITFNHAEPHPLRVKSVATVGGGIEIEFYEKVPLSLSTPPPQTPVLLMSEWVAMVYLTLLEGGIVKYLGSDLYAGFTGEIFSFRANGSLSIPSNRIDFAHPLYSFTLPLQKHNLPQVTR